MVSVNTSLLFCIVILKFDVICVYSMQVRIQYQQLLESGVTRDENYSNTLARILI